MANEENYDVVFHGDPSMPGQVQSALSPDLMVNMIAPLASGYLNSCATHRALTFGFSGVPMFTHLVLITLLPLASFRSTT